jgi:hypothetical protein
MSYKKLRVKNPVKLRVKNFVLKVGILFCTTKLKL